MKKITRLNTEITYALLHALPAGTRIDAKVGNQKAQFEADERGQERDKQWQCQWEQLKGEKHTAHVPLDWAQSYFGPDHLQLIIVEPTRN